MDLTALLLGVVLGGAATASVLWFRPRLTVGSVFCSVWGALLVLQGVFHPISVAVPPLVLWAVGLAGLSAIVGSGGVILWRRRRGESSATMPVLSPRGWSWFVRTHLVLCGLLVGYIVLQFVAMWPTIEMAGGFFALFSATSGGARELKALLASTANSSSPFGGSVVIGALSYIAFIGNVSLFSGAVLARRGRWVIALVPIAINGVFSVVTFQRNSFVLASLIFAAAWLVAPAQQQRSRSVRSILQGRGWMLPSISAGAAVVIVIGILLIPIQLRNSTTTDSSGVLSLGQYFFGSLGGFGARVDPSASTFVPPAVAGVTSPVPGYGAYTFTKAIGLLAKVGLPVTVPPYVYDYYSVDIFGRDFSTNTATMLYDFYLDGGFVWIVVAMLILSGIGTWFQTSPTPSTRLISLPIVAYTISVAAWSFFTASLLRDTRQLLMTLCACALAAWLLRVDRSRSRADVESREPAVETSEMSAVDGE